MKNLVSRNLVLRFKLGKKIEKFLNPSRGINSLGKYVGGGTKIINGIKDLFKGWNINSGIIPLYKQNISTFQTPTQKTSTDYSWMKGGTRLRTLEELKKWEAENLRRLNLLKNDPRISHKTPLSRQLVNNIWIKGYNRRPEITDVRAMLQKLWDLGLLKESKFGVDGKWGKDTEKAYLQYLALKNIPTYEKPEMPSVAEMAGIYSEENRPLYQRIRFKQGGNLLPSRNIVKRFKSFRKEAL